MRQYYVHNGLKEIGPFDIENLKQQDLKKDTPIWYEGIDAWTNAIDIEELKSLFIGHSKPPPLNKATPPPIIDATKKLHTHISNEVFPKKNRAYLISSLIVGLIVVGSVLGWLIYQNLQNSDTIENLNEEVSSTKHILQKEKDEVESQQAKRQSLNRELTLKNMNYRNNWRDYIKAKSNKYLYREMGGISSLEVNITNSTDYMLDEVVVLVNYIKTNGDNFKTETVILYNIPANSSKSVSAPESNRGTSVSMDIQSIISKKMHFCYSSGYWGNNSEDPYFCK